MQHQVGVCLTGIIQHAVEILKEIGAAPAPLHARPYRVIKAQVGIGEEDEAY